MKRSYLLCICLSVLLQTHDALANPTTSKEVQQRGLLDAYNPMSYLSPSSLPSVSSFGSGFLANSAGQAMETMTGVNPVKMMDMPRKMVKKAIRTTRNAIDKGFEFTDSGLETAQNVLDSQKKMIDEQIKPLIPLQLVSDSVDMVHGGVDAALSTIKDQLQNAKETTSDSLLAVEEYFKKPKSTGILAAISGSKKKSPPVKEPPSRSDSKRRPTRSERKRKPSDSVED